MPHRANPSLSQIPRCKIAPAQWRKYRAYRAIFEAKLPIFIYAKSLDSSDAFLRVSDNTAWCAQLYRAKTTFIVVAKLADTARMK